VGGLYKNYCHPKELDSTIRTGIRICSGHNSSSVILSPGSQEFVLKYSKIISMPNLHRTTVALLRRCLGLQSEIQAEWRIWHIASCGYSISICHYFMVKVHQIHPKEFIPERPIKILGTLTLSIACILEDINAIAVT
jgi:hypothetical protein